ncbi:hypothetical protein INT47_010341 [Mucor saturninus]|uniref:Uncharacterized protein n=1 Tax=Mucor saturninus TaxID=64648 RepID=A0A8H7UMR3_9FUNG|nr:hypothetical protein INT47_010341 [Mucor saturninus]
MNSINNNAQDDAEEEPTSVQNLDEQYADDDTVVEEASARGYTFMFEDAIRYKHFDHDYNWNIIQKFGIGLIKLLDHNGVSRQVQRDVVKHINGNLLSYIDPVAVSNLGGLLPSPEAIHRLLDKSSIDAVKTYDVCREGCFLFDDDVQQSHCINPAWGEGRYKDQDKAEESIRAGDISPPKAFQTMAMSSVGASLAEPLVDDKIREDFKYASQFSDKDEDGVYIDMFSGSVYKEFLRQNLLTRNDICLVLDVDGFPNKSKPGSSQTLVHCMVMNIPASKRAKESMMIPLAILPGPKSPSI